VGWKEEEGRRAREEENSEDDLKDQRPFGLATLTRMTTKEEC
jgi:hypothetical protein